MLDFHSHFLPRIDDGSSSAEESFEMLRESFKQGVTEIIATPHFYPASDVPDDWVLKRNTAFKTLEAGLSDDMPKIRLGAEVYYYEGIAHSDEIMKLRIEGTEFLLLELPFQSWTPHILQSVYRLNDNPGVTVVLAHIDRYIPFGNIEAVEQLRSEGILMQVNADFFTRKTRRQALRLLKSGMIDFIGSDCHNMTDRTPNLGHAAELIDKAIGSKLLKQFIDGESKLMTYYSIE